MKTAKMLALLGFVVMSTSIKLVLSVVILPGKDQLYYH